MRDGSLRRQIMFGSKTSIDLRSNQEGISSWKISTYSKITSEFFGNAVLEQILSVTTQLYVLHSVFEYSSIPIAPKVLFYVLENMNIWILMSWLVSGQRGYIPPRTPWRITIPPKTILGKYAGDVMRNQFRRGITFFLIFFSQKCKGAEDPQTTGTDL